MDFWLFFNWIWGCTFLKTIKDEEYLCRDLVKSDVYQNLLEQIEDKEREMKYLDMEYMSLINERDELELKIDSLNVRISSSTNAVMIEDMMIESVFDKGEQEIHMVDGKKNSGPVRRRNIHEEMRNMRKGETFN